MRTAFLVPFLAGLALALLQPLLPAQTVGGTEDLKWRFDGQGIGEFLGDSVGGPGDVDGDGFDDLLVGARFTDPNGLSHAGSAFVFSGATGIQLFRFDGLAAGDTLGWSVAGAGDVDGDGRPDLIVGAPFSEPNGFFEEGSAFVFSGATGAQLFRFDGLAVGYDLGWSVAGGGDVDGDGFDDVIVGAPTASPNGIGGAGSAFVFSGATGAQLWRFDGLTSGGELGRAVAGAGDVDGDGIPDLIVGAPYADPNGLNAAGSAFVFSGATGTQLRRFDGLAGDQMGFSVAGGGDMDGDGLPDLIVGAYAADPNGVFDAGSAFVFSGATGAQLWRFDGLTGEELGYSVAGAGDVDGDGFDDLIAGAATADPSGLGLSEGSAFVFSGATGAQLFRFDGQDPGDFLGCSVDGAGDVDGDGRPDLVVGSRLANPNTTTDAGSAFVYTFNPILTASEEVLSFTSGGTIDYTIDFPDVDAGASYGILFSAHGTGPSTRQGLLIPLAQDKFFRASWHGNAPAFTSGFQGTLDAQGQAAAQVVVPGGVLPLQLAGYQIPITLAVINSNFDFSSVARTLSFTL